MEWWAIILIVLIYVVFYFFSSLLFALKIKYLSDKNYQLAGITGASGLFISFTLYGFAAYIVIILATWWAFFLFVSVLSFSSWLSVIVLHKVEVKYQKRLQLEKENFIF